MRNEQWPDAIQGIRDVLVEDIDRRMDRWIERQDDLRRPQNPKLSLARMLYGMAHERLEGEDREVLEETAKR